ncbi:DUF3500 domain-containing protein [Corynebacterium matruchotii]|uniref:DUF3500 domain-containing protein n=2 Tax=Corynebacterium matruchotii TaxID=43768 RepID=E0DEJ6_9CORY|nr:DUF3500 domain-containing protein [Corynebacterium matruchotii]EFM49421.1 hypothetical protein HMPREF0299_7392 [Corynebacterium matruchotii ATCC 14266]KAB1925962.1 DUF3500 domain-containing protein [Corynebacterium matruchotii]QIP45055.1 DUF3500 domain-containing protein [Corynebacterium matruchotii]SPW28665.1 putative secreted protein [Corynebacterium matruchotii]
MSNKFWKKSFPLASLILAGGLTIASCTTGTTDTATAQGGTSIVRQVADTTSTSKGTTSQTISDTAKAAEEFLSTLSDEQKEQVLYDYDDETKSTSWSNFPVTFVERSGIKLGDLGETQRAAALKVLKALLNDEAYAKVTGIMAGDQYLKDNTNASDLGNTQYNIAFFGSPSTTNDWSIQFGGHHVGINATFSNGAITFAPTHLGTQPTTYTDSNGQTQSALGDMYQTAFDFYNSLTDEQKQKLYQGEEVKNLTCAPSDTCDYPTGTGIKGSELTDEQKQLLLKVIANWTNLADSETTQATMDQISATLDDTYVNWSGATVYDTSQGKGIYFQISGPKVYIELASQDNDAGATVSGVQTSGWGHIHTIYRDPTNDYAGSVTQQKSSGPTGGGPGGSGSGGPGGSGAGSGGPGSGNGGPSDAPGRSGAPAGAPGGKPGDSEPGQTSSNTSKSTSKSATAGS